MLGSGKHVILDIDVQGAKQIQRAFPRAVTVFVLPPSGEVLLERLRARKSESPQQLVVRLHSALEELRAVDAYQYVVVNDDLSSTYMAQDDGITTANLVAASANLNSSLTVAAPSAVNMPSATVLLSSSFANTPTLIIKLQGLVEIPGNEYGAYAKWQCRINNGYLTGSGTTGA